jgi:phage-related protein
MRHNPQRGRASQSSKLLSGSVRRGEILNAFQKKSKKGVATPKPDIDLIKSRLRAAEEAYNE